MYLLINTANVDDFFLGLIDAKGKFLAQGIYAGRYAQAEKILPCISQLLNDSGVSLVKLKGITIATGPGPFTALRIGIATANTLGWVLKIPVLGLKAGEFANQKKLAKTTVDKIKKVKLNKIIEPFYGKEPNITIKGKNGLSH